MENETIAQEAKRLLDSVPAEDFITLTFTDGRSKCCGLGHYMRLTSSDPTDYRDTAIGWHMENRKGSKVAVLRSESRKFLSTKYGINESLANVNNDPIFNGYTEPLIKDRVIHLLDDMIAAGY